EGYGGLEVRGGFPLSPGVDRWSRGGIFRGDRSDLDPNLWPQFQPVDVAPALGVAVESQGVTWLHSRLTYRRVYNTGASNTSEFASGLTTPVVYSGTRISQERLGYAVTANHPKIGGVQGGLTYDFYANRFPSLYASAETYIGEKVTAGIDYDFYQPAFDGDSIWNFFASQPTHYMGVRGNVEISDKAVTLSVNSQARSERGRAMLEPALAGLVRAPLAERQTVEQMMAASPRRLGKTLDSPPLPPDELKKVVHQGLTDHYRRTLDEPVPALGNRAPRQAAKTAKGRDKVVAWLKLLENSSGRHEPDDPMASYDFTWMWEELGVAEHRQ
ncbi:MAG: hypothetical protein HY269_10575, partial [Deltaproteobacteria bacterium]|nr:hypothetical protein [Deltaproteobacteria bacterium]